MSRYYTSTVWHVKPGLEEEFMRRWEEFVDWTDATGLGAREMLLRDVDRPRRFVSFGVSSLAGPVANWQRMPGYREQLARIGEVIEELESHLLEALEER